MTATERYRALASQARRVYIEALVRGMAPLGAALNEAAHQLLQQPAEYPVMVARRDGVAQWIKLGPGWQTSFISGLRHAAVYGVSELRQPVAADAPQSPMTLVDDDTIEREITGSRLALAMMDRATWEFTDLRTRMQVHEAREDLPALDLLRAHVVARLVLEAWSRSGLSASVWQMLKITLHEEFTLLLGEAYHEVNRWLVEQRVMPEVDLRPFIRRSAGTVSASGGAAGDVAVTQVDTRFMAHRLPGADAPPARSRAAAQADEVLQQLQRVLGRKAASATTRPPTSAAPSMAAVPSAQQPPPIALSARLNAALQHVQHAQHAQDVQQAGQAGQTRRPGTPGVPGEALRAATESGAEEVSPARAPQLLEEIRSRNQAFKQVLKQAAETPAERATIEIVALLFQSILMEERIPATVRVWFARLQMPVLRVAVSEPDFFATNDHPARRLIDRMGACVMGFNAASASGGISEALEREIKRVVQVVEAYPDTGRRVFQTVLTEFEKFLDHYFENENEATRKGVSLAQQVEQRETLAIQYTIELRKMLNEVPVQDGVRDFLFQVWADVLAVTAVRSGAQSEATRLMKRAAADLIWSASAKVSREERAEVIRRLPPLLKTLRDGMSQAGLPLQRQDEHVQSLNNALAAAFTAKTAAIPRERLEELMDQLEALEAMLPDTQAGSNLDDSLVRDLSGHETDGLEVVAEGGTMPTPAMQAWARELQVGGWYMLDYRSRNEAVQLAWRGMRRQLALFVTPNGRGVLFPLNRMAAFLQAGLLLPAQEESLTVKATRNALAKLEVDPSRLE